MYVLVLGVVVACVQLALKNYVFCVFSSGPTWQGLKLQHYEDKFTEQGVSFEDLAQLAEPSRERVLREKLPFLPVGEYWCFRLPSCTHRVHDSCANLAHFVCTLNRRS